MQVYDLGDCARVRIPRATDPDHHDDGKVGQVVGVRRSGLATATDDPRDASLYRVAFDDSTTGEMLFCHRDLTMSPEEYGAEVLTGTCPDR